MDPHGSHGSEHGEIRHRSIGSHRPPLLPPDLSFDIQVVPGHETSLGEISELGEILHYVCVCVTKDQVGIPNQNTPFFEVSQYK